MPQKAVSLNDKTYFSIIQKKRPPVLDENKLFFPRNSKRKSIYIFQLMTDSSGLSILSELSLSPNKPSEKGNLHTCELAGMFKCRSVTEGNMALGPKVQFSNIHWLLWLVLYN